MNSLTLKKRYFDLYLSESIAQSMHLQWFAAEDEGRTEDPTEHKLRKSREEGKVAKSADLVGAIVLIFSISAMGLLASYILDTMIEMMQYFLRQTTILDTSTTGLLLPAFYNYFLRTTLPIIAVAFIAALLGNIFQVGFLFSTKPITPDLKRISPNFLKFFKKSFLSMEALFNFMKSIVKVIIIALVAYLNISGNIHKMTQLLTMPFLVGIAFIARLGFFIVIEAAIVMLILSIPDYLFQRMQHKESLKMSKQEIKEERKQQEGDPMVKSRMKERMRQLLSNNMMQKVPEADVVITNPTHYAIGLEYDQAKMVAPIVIAKGYDELAQRIKKVAKENDVPVIENKPLARALHAEVEIGDMVPEKYWKVTALVLKEVYEMKGKAAKAV
ncbi:MAG: flagellar biosynthesis protein FlhB [Spirochaetia bacterium]